MSFTGMLVSEFVGYLGFLQRGGVDEGEEEEDDDEDSMKVEERWRQRARSGCSGCSGFSV